MDISKKGKAFLASMEGVATHLYLDSVNVRTIGIGATISEIANINSLPWSYNISLKECFELFDRSLVKYVRSINSSLKVDVKQSQFDALTSICYNIGTGGASKSTFMRLINAKAPVGRVSSFLNVPHLIELLDLEETKTDRSISYEEIKDSFSFSLTNTTIVDAIKMWNKPKEIRKRREREAKLFSSGDYGDCRVNLFPVSESSHKPIYSKGKLIEVSDYL